MSSFAGDHNRLETMFNSPAQHYTEKPRSTSEEKLAMMKSARWGSLLLATSLFALSGQVLSAPQPEQPKPVFGELVSPAEVPELIAMVRSELAPGGRWEEVPRKARPALESRLVEIEQLLEGRSSIDELSEDDKIRLINAQEHANSILTANDGERIVCERVKPIYSHIGQVLCVTRAQRNNMRDAGRDGVTRLQQTGRKETVR